METHREGLQGHASKIEVKTKTGAATKMTAEVEEPTTKATGEENKPKAHPKRKRTHQTKREPIKPKLKTGTDFELGFLRWRWWQASAKLLGTVAEEPMAV